MRAGSSGGPPFRRIGPSGPGLQDVHQVGGGQEPAGKAPQFPHALRLLALLAQQLYRDVHARGLVTREALGHLGDQGYELGVVAVEELPEPVVACAGLNEEWVRGGDEGV